MGNTITKRTTTRTSQTTVHWDEANVLRLITENKLAPKHPENKANGSQSTCECPICFLDFAVLNTVNCCKQSICTDCVVQLKATDVKCACPFCGNNELSVSLIPVDKSRRNSTGSVSTKDRSSSVSESDRSSGSSQSQQVNLSYTTPEQEKKLRSLSVDNTSNVSSRNDRETLERQIREQRLQFDERDLAEAQRSGVRGRGGYHNSAGAAAGSPFLRHARLGRYGLPEEATSPGGRTGSGAGLLRSPGSSSRAGAAGSTIDNATNSFVSSIENLLQSQSSGGATRITSIQQLEDIMLMEAIRLSMQDVEQAGAGDNGNNGDDEGSSSRPSTSAAPAATANMQASLNSPLRSPFRGSAHHSPSRSPSRIPTTSGSSTAAGMPSPGRVPTGSPNTSTSLGSDTTLSMQSNADMSSLSAAISRLQTTPAGGGGGSSETSTVATSSVFSAATAQQALPGLPRRQYPGASGDGGGGGETEDQMAYSYSHAYNNGEAEGEGVEYTESDEEEEQIRLAMELSLAFSTTASASAAGEKYDTDTDTGINSSCGKEDEEENTATAAVNANGNASCAASSAKQHCTVMNDGTAVDAGCCLAHGDVGVSLSLVDVAVQDHNHHQQRQQQKAENEEVVMKISADSI